MNLYLLQYNNYFNRIIKKEETLEDYLTGKKYGILAATNFNFNDGINTEHLINWNEDFVPNYLLVVNEGTIVTRWFITYMTRTRGKQYKLELKRDVIADNYNVVVNAPCFVEKGFVNDSNPLIYNQENFSCNQIKTKEYLLSDDTKCSWITLYYNLSHKNDLSGQVSTIEQPYISINAEDLEHWEYYTYITNGYKKAVNKEFKVLVHSINPSVVFRYKFDSNAEFYAYEGQDTTNTGLDYTPFPDEPTRHHTISYTETVVRPKVIECINTNKSGIAAAIGNAWNPSVSVETLSNYNDRIVKFNDNNFYLIRFYPSSVGQTTSVTNMDAGTARTSIEGCFLTGGSWKEGWSGNFINAIQQRITYENFIMTAEPYTNGVLTYNYDYTDCQDIQDQPFGVLCFPYQSTQNGPIKFLIGEYAHSVRAELPMLIAKDLIKKGTGSSGVIYDAQILPYCPLPDLAGSYYGSQGLILNMNPVPDSCYSYITDASSHKVMLALHPTNSRFTRNITVSGLSTMDPVKVENQCSFYRLCSPNFNGQYEFNRARNKDLHYFNIDCTYKPYAPYIHVNPDFGGLYGTDFNDPRGLVCGGDFSLTVINSAWEQYKLQNKNYNEIFARQIENMNKMNNYQHAGDVVGSLAGSISGTASGALAGGMFGGVPGAIGGAVVGGVTSLAGGVADVALNQARFRENKDYATDIHNYQLQNIQAIPDSLTKVDAFNNNNKIWPILEYYTCTDVEKTIFENKLVYEGMTVNAVGTILDYKGSDQTFVKGQIIRLEELEDDTYMARTIYDEISKGVYL